MRKSSFHGELPVTRADALAAGSQFYRPETPCGNGHISPRYTVSYNCVECLRLSSAKYANINKQPKAWHRAHLKRQYGMTREAYDALAQAQGERCAICGTADTGTSAKRNRHHWSVDHCHTTNQIRGLLCNLCNMMLGYARDNPQTLLMAARYLGRGSPKADASVATALLSMGV